VTRFIRGVDVSLLSRITMVLLAVAATPHVTWAAPSVRVMERGGNLQVYASNPEARAYECTLGMVWSHSSFGSRRQVVVKQGVSVGPQTADSLIYTGGTGSFDLRVDSAPTLACR
jgi:hypothetical protein